MNILFCKSNWLPRVIKSNGYAANFQLRGCKRNYSESQECAVTAAPAAAEAEAPREPLMDLHGRRHTYLRISLTERCNLRCRYCMPREGVPLSARAALLSRAELARAVRVLAALGVARLRLTGGEPALRPDLAAVVAELRVPGVRDVGLTSNGVALLRSLPALRRAGLDRLNLSLDSLRPARARHMARREGALTARALAAADLGLQLGLTVKINVVLIKGFNDDEISDFVELTRDRELEVRFIEFMPFSGNEWSAGGLVPHAAALAAARARHALAPEPPRPHDTAQLWRARGHAGRVGFISSITRPFCASCNRLRLTADGNLKVCLFGGAEVSLRDALRAGCSDAELEALVRAALRNKHKQHAGYRAASPAPSRAPAALTRSPLARTAARPAGGCLPAHDPHRRLAARALATRAGGEDGGDGGGEDGGDGGGEDGGGMSHLDGAGRARMVDVGDKPVTARAAAAECRLEVSARLLRLLADARLPKGDALCVARVAGALAAKRTAELLPLCHPLPLDCARVAVRLPRGAAAAAARAHVTLECEVRVTARTGAEMEALTGCAVAALALYDMCKSVDRDMTISGLRLVRKSGGRSGDVGPPPPPLRPLAPRADDGAETYAPTNFMNF